MAHGGVCVLGLRRARVRNRLDASSYTSSRTHDRRCQHGHRRVHGRTGTGRGSGRPHCVHAQPPTGPLDLCAAGTGGRGRGALDRGRPDASHTRVRVGVRRGRRRASLFDSENRVLVRRAPGAGRRAWCHVSHGRARRRHIADATGRGGRPSVWRQHRWRRDRLAGCGLRPHPDHRPHEHDADGHGGECREHCARTLLRPAQTHGR